MKQKKRVIKRRKKGGKIAKLAAAAGLRFGQRKRPLHLPEELSGMY